jgi:two-component system, LytTR family, response regulator
LAKYNCIIVDDDEIARLKVVSMINQFPILKLLGHFTSANEASSLLEKERVDIVFSDIDMPYESGLDFRKRIMHIPVCIFITSYPEHAITSFELEALDYIVKPLTLDRFSFSVKRIEAFLDIKQKAALFDMSYAEDIVYIKEGYERTKVKLSDIQYIEALKDFCLLSTPQKRHCVSKGLGRLMEEQHFKSFVRVHRSYAVQKIYVKKIGAQQIVLTNDFKVPIGDSYKDNISLLT